MAQNIAGPPIDPHVGLATGEPSGGDRLGGTVIGASLVATMGGLLFGYDTAVISGAIGFLVRHFQLSPAMEGWAAASALVGCVIGSALAGPIGDRWGRRTALRVAAVLFLVSAVGTALPRTLTEFVLYRALGGIGVGAAALTSPLYIAELAPARHRGRLVSWNQMAIVIGMLVVYFVNWAIARQGDLEWNVRLGWRWMFGSEALPAAAFLGLLFTVPESPRWLIRRGDLATARAVLVRIAGPAAAEAEIADVTEALASESESFGELLRPRWRRPMAIGLGLAVFQQVTGINVFLYFAPEILQRIAGAGVDAALLQTVLVGAVNMSGTILAIRTVDRWGRRPLLLTGYAGMGAALLTLGLAAAAQRIAGWTLVPILIYIAAFSMSVGPVTWVVLSEIFPTRLRARAMAVATVALWTANYVVSQTFPMMDRDPGLVARFHHGFPFLIYAAMCAGAWALVARAVPETRGRSLEEIERSWSAAGRSGHRETPQ
ncbi:MAG: sugar porter family MFS transporter [Kiritimatiellae bacterium]|nr:sugar porter family MFS transporter [Kiritimatiellia bacterium]